MADEEVVFSAPAPEEVDLAKEHLAQLYRSGESRTINPERWERARTEIEFEDVVEELTGQTSFDKIRCPFHGSDRTPSFAIYRNSNDGWCFGCPPPKENQYYDNIRFASRYLGISRVKALVWLEKFGNLPPLDDVIVEVEEKEVTIEFRDLSEAYITLARRDVLLHRDLELAREYLHMYFQAEGLSHEADAALKDKEAEPDEAKRYRRADELSIRAASMLANVLGSEAVQKIVKGKAGR